MGVDTSIVENNFLKKYTANYDLSVLAGMDRFSFLISDKQANLLALKSYQLSGNSPGNDNLYAKLREVYLKDDLLKLPFNKVNVAVVNGANTYVPDPLYDDSNPAIFLDNLVDPALGSVIQTDNLTALEAKNIYRMDSTMQEGITNYFPNAQTVHAMTPLILGLQNMASHHVDNKIYVHIRDKLAHIFLFEKETLLFANTFTFQTDKDFIYYVMLVYDQFKMKPEEVPLYFSGFIIRESQLYHQLYRYIRFLNHLPRPVFYNYGSQFNDVTDYFFFDLLSIKLCE